jgi:hypothetical protein
MNCRANCYDNATMESFRSTLKRTLIHHCHFATRAQVRKTTIVTGKDTLTSPLCKDGGYVAWLVPE